jgi:2-oxoglutarate ferredoxin oxidoreductase subunit gamma
MINEKLIVAGFGGQGVMTLGQMLAYMATEKGLNTLWFPSYGPETRGGTANCSVTISESPVNSPVISKPDSIIIMNKPSLSKFQPMVKEGGYSFVNSDLVRDLPFRENIRTIEVPANSIALELGNIKVANMVMMGAYLKATELFSLEEVKNIMSQKFTGSKSKLIDTNMNAILRGMEYVN